MPTFIDIHEINGLTAEAVAKAHEADLEKQGKYGVNYLKYWVNESCGKAFCLIHAPNAEMARQVHLESHGMAAEKIIEVQPEIAEGFLGGGEVNQDGAALLGGQAAGAFDPAIRTVIFTDIVGSTGADRGFQRRRRTLYRKRSSLPLARRSFLKRLRTFRPSARCRVVPRNRWMIPGDAG